MGLLKNDSLLEFFVYYWWSFWSGGNKESSTRDPIQVQSNIFIGHIIGTKLNVQEIGCCNSKAITSLQFFHLGAAA